MRAVSLGILDGFGDPEVSDHLAQTRSGDGRMAGGTSRIIIRGRSRRARKTTSDSLRGQANHHLAAILVVEVGVDDNVSELGIEKVVGSDSTVRPEG